MTKELLFLSITIFLLQPSLAFAKQFLVHAKTSLKIDDAQICAVPNVAWTALQNGHEVTILFDASGVTSLKRGGKFGGDKTPLDKAALPELERQSLSFQLKTPLEQIPQNYGQYIRFLKEKGVKLFANKTMMLLYKIPPEDIDQSAIPISLKEINELFNNTETYVAY